MSTYLEALRAVFSAPFPVACAALIIGALVVTMISERRR